MSDDDIDEILGITRCARCGQRLDGDVECPFCSLFPEPVRKREFPKWIYMTACFLTSPLSLYFVIRTDRLNIAEKLITSAGCIIWAWMYLYWF